jgi:hypothetical protein
MMAEMGHQGRGGAVTPSGVAGSADWTKTVIAVSRLPAIY